MSMYVISFTQNLSLAYSLGHSAFSEELNQALYGYSVGHKVRGYNLEVKVHWNKAPDTSVLSLKEKTQIKLKAWDHSYLNEWPEFSKDGPACLERICLLVASQFESEAEFLKVEVKQNSWTAEYKKTDDKINLSYQNQFQSLLDSSAGYRPLDFKLTAQWSGEVSESTGILYPWTLLKAQLSESFVSLSNKGPDFFQQNNVAEFLTELNRDLLNKSPGSFASVAFEKPILSQLSFQDVLDKSAFVFNE